MHTDLYKQHDCYKVLGASPNATLQEIRSAYWKASKLSHPDRGGSHEAQVKVNLAYEVLSDPVSRQAHDVFWRVSAPHSTNGPKSSTTSSGGYPKGQEGAAPDDFRQTRRETHTREPLGGLRQRVSDKIKDDTAKIWRDLGLRVQSYTLAFGQRLSNKRQEAIFAFVGAVGLGAITLALGFPLLWIGVAYLGWMLVSTLSGVMIENRGFSILDSDPTDSLRQHAERVAKESCVRDSANLDRHLTSIASLAELLLRSTSFDDSETQVARRLTASLFLMGYIPIQYDRENRTLLFTDGEERMLVRFRHRPGAATNIAYVAKLVGLMKACGATRGYVFCSPGLSGNAASYANSNKVQWHTLETMNQWIDKVALSDYSGPAGDILVELDKLMSFMNTLSPVIGAHYYRSRS